MATRTNDVLHLIKSRTSMEDIIKETKILIFKKIEISQINRGIIRNSSELIGRTPLVRSNHMIDGLEAEVVAKPESFNP